MTLPYKGCAINSNLKCPVWGKGWIWRIFYGKSPKMRKKLLTCLHFWVIMLQNDPVWGVILFCCGQFWLSSIDEIPLLL